MPRLLSFVGRHFSSQADREMRQSRTEGAWPRLCPTLAGLHQLRQTEMVLQGTRVIARVALSRKEPILAVDSAPSEVEEVHGCHL